LSLSVNKFVRVLWLFPVEKLIVNKFIALADDCAIILRLLFLRRFGLDFAGTRRLKSNLAVKNYDRWLSSFLFVVWVGILIAVEVESAFLRLRCNSLLLTLLQRALSVVPFAGFSENISFTEFDIFGPIFLPLFCLSFEHHELIVKRGV
jgi:hypothetical protein